MAEERVQRRLAAILAADVVGYSRLMEADEAGTLSRLKSLRKEIIDSRIAADGGRIVKTTGDGMLVEFASAVDAVRNAIAIQHALGVRDADEVEDQRIQWRIGVTLGDVIIDGDDIHGDGVNVAARLEGLCEPGAVYVSGSVYDQVVGKLAATFDDLGEQAVKNIDKPIRVYRASEETRSDEPASVVTETEKPFDTPSIAVLPFANLSGDLEQEYFADGMAEDIITALSRFRGFFVIARNSSFTYKGRAVDVREVGRDLGVRYVLEGSVRRSGNRLRITAQLVEAATGNHLWAERYDGEMADVFDLQDRITEGVVGAVEPSVRQAEIERSRRKRPDNLAAYDLYLRALPHAWANTPQEASKALDLLEQALEIDPSYVAAHAIAGWCRLQRTRFGGRDPKEWSDAVENARKVIASGTDDAVSLAFAGFTLIFDGRHDAALDAVARAVELNPNSAVVLGRSAVVNALAGNDDIAMDHAQRSIRLSPVDPMRYTPEVALCVAHFHGGSYAEAAEAAQRVIKYSPGFEMGYAFLVASYVRLGRLAEAKKEARRLLEINPNFRVNSRFLNALRAADPITTAMREAGLPE